MAVCYYRNSLCVPSPATSLSPTPPVSRHLPRQTETVAPSSTLLGTLPRVASVGRRSVRVEVQMWSEAPESGLRRACTTGQLVYVALDA